MHTDVPSDDRIAMREYDAIVKRREDAVAEREARVAEREALVLAALPASARKAAEVAPVADESTVARLTTAPFKIARAVLGGKK